MHPSERALELFAEYRELHHQDRFADRDALRSLRYFTVDLALQEGRTAGEGSVRILEWVTALQRLERFALREGRLPRENNRLSWDGISGEERTLNDWSRYQRRPAARAKHCRYQARRLETIPGFAWVPLDEQWRAQFAAHFGFVDQYGAPAIRSRNPEERRIAAWAARQRRAHARGTLPPARFVALEATSRWVWTGADPASS